MTRTLKALIVAVVAGGSALGAQGAVPEIAFDTNVDLLRTPPTSTSARSAASARIRRARSSSTRAPAIPTPPSATTEPSIAAARGFSSSTRTASSCASWDRTSTASTLPSGCASIRQDNVWTIDDGANQVVKFDTEGRVALVLGRKPETMPVRPAAPRPGGGPGGAGPGRSGRRPGPGVGAGPGAGAGPGGAGPGGADRAKTRRGHAWFQLQPSHRRGVGCGRQHLRRRRHRREQPRRQVRQGRPLHQALGLHRLGAGAVPGREGDGHRRAGQRLRGRRRQQAHPGVRRRRHLQEPVRGTSARRWRCA